MRAKPALSSPVEFRRDPLLFLDQQIRPADAVFRLPDATLCVVDPAVAKDVLSNAGGNFHEHSDFFHIRRGVFGPRHAQIEIGRQARLLVRQHVSARAHGLAELVDRRLAPTSQWPDAGNELLYEHLGSALLSGECSPRLRATLDRVVAHAVMAGARERRGPLARMALRHSTMRELMATVSSRRAAANESLDLLDAVMRAAPDARDSDIAEVFLSFLFAVAGSIGFALGWSLYLLGANAATDAPPSYVLREALRLWPVAWMFARRPAHPQELAGVAITPRDTVVVCSYLVHRHPGHWSRPDVFAPQRWSEPSRCHAFVPFGWGPHACPGAALALDLVEDLLRIITEGYRVAVHSHRTRPHIGPALAPPPFTLHLTHGQGLART